MRRGASSPGVPLPARFSGTRPGRRCSHARAWRRQRSWDSDPFAGLLPETGEQMFPLARSPHAIGRSHLIPIVFIGRLVAMAFLINGGDSRMGRIGFRVCAGFWSASRRSCRERSCLGLWGLLQGYGSVSRRTSHGHAPMSESSIPSAAFAGAIRSWVWAFLPADD